MNVKIQKGTPQINSRNDKPVLIFDLKKNPNDQEGGPVLALT